MARDRTAEEGIGTDERRVPRSPLDRRSYLRLSAGVAAGSATGVGAVSARGPDGLTSVDVVAAGADPTGETVVDEVVRDLAADDTRLVFPSGTYRVGDLALRGYDGLELIAPDGATLLFSAGPAGGLSLIDCTDVAIEGFDTDTAVSRVVAAETASPVSTVEFAAGDGAPATYWFTVDGDVWRRPTDRTAEGTDVFGPSVEGAIAADVVTYEYTGSITDFRLRGDAVVTVDGRTLDELGVERRARSTELVVAGEPEHALDVDGDVESVRPGAYRLTGTLSSLHVAGESTVELTRV